MVKPEHIGRVEGRLSCSYEVIDEDVGRPVFQADALQERANLLGRTSKQICNHPNDKPDKISHPARASPDSRSTASQIEFATGTP